MRDVAFYFRKAGISDLDLADVVIGGEGLSVTHVSPYNFLDITLTRRYVGDSTSRLG
jgi:hypothetical protein